MVLVLPEPKVLRKRLEMVPLGIRMLGTPFPTNRKSNPGLEPQAHHKFEFEPRLEARNEVRKSRLVDSPRCALIASSFLLFF